MFLDGCWADGIGFQVYRKINCLNLMQASCHYSLFIIFWSISCEQKNYLSKDKNRRNTILRLYGSILGPFLEQYLLGRLF